MIYVNTIKSSTLMYMTFFIFTSTLIILFLIRKNRKFTGINFINIALFLYYIQTAYAMIILPLPEIDSIIKTRPLIEYAQLIPFNFISDFKEYLSTNSIHNFFLSHVFLQVFFNILLLMPLGLFSRNLFELSLKKAILISFFVSLFFEVSQLTGLFFIYKAPYRLFDIDDLFMNTSGALIGFCLGKYVHLFKNKKTEYVKTQNLKMVYKIFIILSELLITNILSIILIIIFNIIFSFNISHNKIFILTVAIIQYFILPILTKKYQSISMILTKTYFEIENDNILNRILLSTKLYIVIIFFTLDLKVLAGITLAIYIIYFAFRIYKHKSKKYFINLKCI